MADGGFVLLCVHCGHRRIGGGKTRYFTLSQRRRGDCACDTLTAMSVHFTRPPTHSPLSNFSTTAAEARMFNSASFSAAPRMMIKLF